MWGGTGDSALPSRFFLYFRTAGRTPAKPAPIQQSIPLRSGRNLATQRETAPHWLPETEVSEIRRSSAQRDLAACVQLPLLLGPGACVSYPPSATTSFPRSRCSL